MVEIGGVRYLTVDEACTVLGVKPATIYAYVSRGVLRSYKQGVKRQRLYREDEVTALLAIQDEPQEATAVEPPPVAAVDTLRGSELPLAESWMGEV